MKTYHSLTDKVLYTGFRKSLRLKMHKLGSQLPVAMCDIMRGSAG